MSFIKIYFYLLIAAVFVTVFAGGVLASGFQVKTVGGLNVDGVTFDQLWYTSGNVTFTGIGTSGETVTADIDGVSGSATVDSTGNWSYSTTLTEGDHAVSFSSGGSTIAFTLTIGAVPEGVGSLPVAETPTVGVAWPTMVMLIFGGALVSAAWMVRRAYR